MLTHNKVQNIAKELKEEASIKITDKLIDKVTDYIKKHKGKIRPSEAASELELAEEDLLKIIDDMKKIVKER